MQQRGTIVGFYSTCSKIEYSNPIHHMDRWPKNHSRIRYVRAMTGFETYRPYTIYVQYWVELPL